jgi:cytochrome d ubiquinol oxidase subunit II
VLAVRAGREKLAFLGTATTAVLVPPFVFACMWPYVLPGRGTPGLTVADAASSPYTLKVMTVVALVMTPIVIGYQAWTWWVLRDRLTRPPVTEDEVRDAVPAQATER